MRRSLLNIFLVLLLTSTISKAQTPAITSFTPMSGPPGTLVTITGTGLASPLTLIIAGTPAAIMSSSANTIVAMALTTSTQGVIQIYTAGGFGISHDLFVGTTTQYPAFQQGSKLVGSGGTSVANQGTAVALSADGNTAIVSGDRDNGSQGAAWIFTRNNGVWSQQGTRLQGSGVAGIALQGISVAISADGNTAVMGGFVDNGGIGAAWVFTRSNGVWLQQGNKLVGTGYLGTPNQGRAVAISGDGNTILVGGNSDDSNQGATWVFTRTNGVWTQQGAKLVGTGVVLAAGQGNALSISADGNTALIGGYGDDSNTGAAWIFTRSNGVWTQQGNKLVGSGGSAPAYQGSAVSLSADGKTAIVGGYFDNGNTGASWIFQLTAGVWAQQGNKLVGTGASDPAWQGSSVAISADGNTAFVGAYSDDGNTGAAWVFRRSHGNWTQKGNKLIGSGASGAARQGWSIAMSADATTALVGADHDDNNQGAAWVFVLPSNDAHLSSLTPSAGNLSPAFAASTTSYSATVAGNITSLSLTPVLTDLNATVTINGVSTASGSASAPISLTVGTNTITAHVVAQDGTTTKDYTISVTRLPSTDASLISLTPSAGSLSPAFTATTFNYTVTVSNAITAIALTPVASDINAIVTVNGITTTSAIASIPITLTVGNNTIQTKVFAQDGVTTKTYTVNINRAGSSNADLSALVSSEGNLSPAFSSTTTSYSIAVAYTTTSITIAPTTADPTALVTVNGITATSGNMSGSIALTPGLNMISIKVFAQDGVTTKIYTVSVTLPASSNADLSSLSLSAGTLSPVFSATTLAYSASVGNATAGIRITPTLSDITAIVTINGISATSGAASAPINLATGNNVINIVVTAQDGITVMTYTLNIVRALSSNADLAALTLSAAALSPSFVSSLLSYHSAVAYAITATTVTPVLSDLTAMVTINGITVTSGQASPAIALSVGNNLILVRITAQDGSMQTYSITINRSAPSANANLAALAIAGYPLTPNFSGSVTAYASVVPYTSSSVTITSVPDDNTASVQLNGSVIGNGAPVQVPLQVGVNTVIITVTAQDGMTTKDYSLSIRRVAPSSDATLSSLVISADNITPGFSTTATTYTSSLSYTTGAIVINPGLHDPTATVQVNGITVTNGTSLSIPLAVGNNTIIIAVTAQDGSTVNHYTLYVRAVIDPITGSSSPLCTGQTRQLSNTTSGGTWSSDDATIATVTNAGLVKAIGTGTTSIHYLVTGATPAQHDEAVFSIQVAVSPVVNISASDTSLCNGVPIVITASAGFSYQWFRNGTLLTANTGAQLSVSTAGTYTTTVTDASGCQASSGNIIVRPIPVIKTNFITGVDRCIDMPVSFTNTSNISNLSSAGFLWRDDNGHTSTEFSPAFLYTQPGNYAVKLVVRDVQCAASADSTTQVITIDKPIGGVAFSHIDVAKNSSVLLQARPFTNAQYNWQPVTYLSAANIASPYISASSDQTYLVTITMSSGCVTTDTLPVRVFEANTFYLPNAFSPNGNGVNDLFRPIPIGIATLRSFRVFNKWGKLIFETNNILSGWNGKYGGVMQPVDTYVWVIEGIDIQGIFISKKGTVTLVR